MKEINFSAPNYGSFSQRIKQDLDGIGRGVEQFARGAGGIYDSYQDELENKRKWDNMIAQQKYQRDRDRIADERYDAEQAYIRSERERMARERAEKYQNMQAGKMAARDIFGAGGEQYDYNQEMYDLDNLQQDYETGGVDSAPGVQFGRETNGARTRARNLVASPMDYETMQYTPGGYVGNDNGAVGQKKDGQQYTDLSKYGEGAMMAYYMMQNATNPEDYNAAQAQLFNIINQRDALEAQRGEGKEALLKSQADDKIANTIALHPIMSTVNRLAAGMPDRQYTAEDVRGMISTLEELERYSMNIADSAKRIEVQSRIDKAYANLQALYGRKSAPGPRRK